MVKITSKGIFAEHKDKNYILLGEVNGEYKIFYEADTSQEMISKIQIGIRDLKKKKG